ncbi:HAD family hydrolase [Xanthomonas citri pv. mangiferaeindicae]|nr:HAD family hydrolase [Xanthomonas citri pv. mangiferaeindicae]
MSGDALFFDLDGTLIDSEPGILGGIAHALHTLGHAPLPRETLLPWIGPPLRDSFDALFAGDADRVDRAISIYRERYDAIGWREHTVYPGVAAAIETLRADGRTLAVVTSKNERFARRIVEALPFGDAFATIVGASDDGARRYKRELIAEALSRLALPVARCTMIGDRRMDMEGARQHRMRAIGVLWGFGSADELRQAGADRVVDSPAALLAAVG